MYRIYHFPSLQNIYFITLLYVNGHNKVLCHDLSLKPYMLFCLTYCLQDSFIVIDLWFCSWTHVLMCYWGCIDGNLRNKKTTYVHRETQSLEKQQDHNFKKAKVRFSFQLNFKFLFASIGDDVYIIKTHYHPCYVTFHKKSIIVSL